MKPSSIFYLLLLLAIPSHVFSQGVYQFHKKNERQIIKSNLLPVLGSPIWAWGSVPVTAEYRLVAEKVSSYKNSLQIALSYLGSSKSKNLKKAFDDPAFEKGMKVKGYRIQATYKYFLLDDEAPHGFYIGPHVSFATAKVISKENHQNYLQAYYSNMNIVCGAQVVSVNGFVFDIYFGLGYKVNTWKANNPERFDLPFGSWESVNPLKVAIDFNMGYAF